MGRGIKSYSFCILTESLYGSGVPESLRCCSPKMLFVFTFCETDDCIDYMNCCFVLYLTIVLVCDRSKGWSTGSSVLWDGFFVTRFFFVCFVFLVHSMHAMQGINNNYRQPFECV